LPVATRRIDDGCINQAAEKAEERRNLRNLLPRLGRRSREKKATTPIENLERPPIRAIAATRN
jgi:hypothetical protein